MSSAHFAWLSTASTDRPMTFVLRLSNSGLSIAIRPSSVVQIGVKSFGCENSTAQESPIQSWNLIFPSVVSAVKSGASSPSCSAMCNTSLCCVRADGQARSRPPGKASEQVGNGNGRAVDNVPHPVTPPTRRRVLAGRVRRLAVDTQPLRASRDFRLLWTGEMISQVGSQVTLVALFVQVYELTHSSAAVGVIGLVQLVPMVFVS